MPCRLQDFVTEPAAQADFSASAAVRKPALRVPDMPPPRRLAAVPSRREGPAAFGKEGRPAASWFGT
jgi:hypothetical protein